MSGKVRWFTDPAEVELDALHQVKNTASMPFVHGVAVMPDVHFGKGSTVGTVVATQGAVMPACVGVDIGCGMIAVRTSLSVDRVKSAARELRTGIERRIPLGIGPYGLNLKLYPSTESRVAGLEAMAEQHFNDKNHMNQRSRDWRMALGSLGGGNHFIEICVGRKATHVDDEGPIVTDIYHDEVWVILHSGSRGVGNRTGNFWTQVALKQAKRYKYDAWLPDPDLAYLVEESEEYWQYMKELQWCQRFAMLNRDEMMDRVLQELQHTFAGAIGVNGIPIALQLQMERINCHHNFTQRETYAEGTFTITRKGAIEARPGMKALIPGSMGARSYIVEGLGCEGAFNSAPHGAGRRMSRTKARAQFTLDGLTERMVGIEANVRPEILDEHPDAYKNIDVVMSQAKALVRPTHVLTQLISVKGD